MKIFVAGTRGIPDIPGGVEKHCQELYPSIVNLGHEVIVATRKPYVNDEQSQWQGVELCHLYAPRKKSLEAIVHTFLAVLEAKRTKADIIHIHAVGPGLLVPFARLLGLKVVVTNHGPDYDREKWGKAAKTMLRLGEYLGGKFANEVIVISTVIKKIVKQRCKRDSHLIYNGVPIPTKSNRTDFLKRQGIKPGKYFLAVARFVPEKGLHDLLEAFKQLDCKEQQLVIAGDADHATKYSKSLKAQAQRDKRVVLTGYIGGEDLNQIYSHAGLFVLPSYHEGLPIALLEAISYELPVLVSDIPANSEVKINENRYFPPGDINTLTSQLGRFMSDELPEQERSYLNKLIADKYNWQKISEQTLSVYQNTFK